MFLLSLYISKEFYGKKYLKKILNTFLKNSTEKMFEKNFLQMQSRIFEIKLYRNIDV